MQTRFYNAPSEALSDVYLLKNVSSIFASDHSIQRDERLYKVFKTADVIEALRGEGYFPVQSAFDEGGYEARTSQYKAGVAEKLVEGGKSLLDALKK